jgi:hypothetical protein
MSTVDKGTWGEQLIASFFDSHFSRHFSFPNPKTKSNAQVADVLVWMNRLAILIEVKTRDEGTASIDDWARSRVQEATKQITTNYKRIKAGEIINLHNQYYHTTLDCIGVTSIIGLVVLVHDEKSNFLPSNAVLDIYNGELPIHVISWNDLQQMTTEIDTVADFQYYLNDRFQYIKTADIPLDIELNVLGYYKIHSNKFPESATDFSAVSYWDIYRSTMSESISKRDSHNQLSSWIDKLEAAFSKPRRLFSGFPLGLYFSWELGGISRRERAYLGQKLDSVQDWFEQGHSSRRFAWLNGSTGNWFVFYFSKSEPSVIHDELFRLVQLKLIKEVNDAAFNYGAYGFGFQVSAKYPPQFLGLASAIIIGAEEVKGKYSKSDLEEAHRNFGPKGFQQKVRIEEFPE